MAAVWKSAHQTPIKTPEGGAANPATARACHVMDLEWEIVTDAVAGAVRCMENVQWSAALRDNMLMVRKQGVLHFLLHFS